MPAARREATDAAREGLGKGLWCLQDGDMCNPWASNHSDPELMMGFTSSPNHSNKNSF